MNDEAYQMAATAYGVNAPEAVKLWSRKLAREALKQTWASRFMGESSNDLAVIKDDTSKGAGDRIRNILRMQLTGAGTQGDGTLEGNEESLVTYTDDLLINQLRHAVRSSGKMTEQRIPFSIREEARMGLQDWWADRLDQWFMDQLSGNTAQTDTRYTGNNAVTAHDANHIISASGTSQLTLSMVDQVVLRAHTLTPVIRPVQTDAGEKYVLFITPEQHYDLRRDTNTLQWGDIQKAAMQGGNISDNPIFTGALGEYNGTILHESYRLPLPGNVGAAVFCGAQAACLGFGRENSVNRMTWVEEIFDYGNQLGVSAGLIAGLKRSIYNGSSFSAIRVNATHSADAIAAAART